jgi:hypothetical protein
LYTEGGQKFTPSTGAIIGIKSDGNAILNSGTVNSDGQVVITETQQMTAASGLAVFELLIEGETHGTANFIVNVERRPSDDAEFSDSDLSMLQEAIDAAEVINEILDEGGDPSEIIEENVNNWLDNHPEATTTVQDGAITAPKINNSLWDKILVNEEASGNPASFEDGADDVPVSSLKVALEPIQLGSGDPSPSNVRPIIAANGINVWDEEWEVGGMVSGTPKPSTNQIRSKNYCACLGNTAYYLHTSKTDGGNQNKFYLAIHWYDDNKNFISFVYSNNGSTVSPSNAAYFKICTNSSTVVYGATYNHDISINYPSTYTAYQPYQGIMVERCGKNLFNDRFSDYTRPYDYRTFPIKLEQGKTYTLKGTKTGNTVTGAYFGVARSGDRYSNFVQIRPAVNADGDTFTYQLIIDETWTDPKLVAYVTDETAWNNALANYHIQLEEGDTATSYEPYSHTSYPYTLGQSVYGGTVDLATGVLTVTDEIVDLGSLTWNKDTNRVGNFYATITGSTTYDTAQKCSSYKVNNSANANTIANGEISSFSSYGGNRVFVKDTDKANMTTSEFKTAMNGVQLVYELANQQTYQLTPQEVKTLLGYNNISSTGTVDVIYHADTKLYIDKKIGELS